MRIYTGRELLARGTTKVTVTKNGPGRKPKASRRREACSRAALRREPQLLLVAAVGMPGGPASRDDERDAAILATITPERERELAAWMAGLMARARH